MAGWQAGEGPSPGPGTQDKGQAAFEVSPLPTHCPHRAVAHLRDLTALPAGPPTGDHLL